MKDTITKRQEKNKQLLLAQLQKTPIVQIACEKTGVSRSTYYRWKKEDKEFEGKANISLREGIMLMNDMAESQLLSLIKDKHPTGIIFWLKHRHPTYAPKIEISANNRDSLTEENISHLSELLYSKNTFKRGQKLLMSYVFKGLISEKFAQLALRMFISQLKAEDVIVRKDEAKIMTEILIRKEKNKEISNGHQ